MIILQNHRRLLIFFVKFIFSQSIDGAESEGLGKYVNDQIGKKANCKMRKVMKNGKPTLCLFATKQINPGEELTYDYGNPAVPWRSLKVGF